MQSKEFDAVIEGMPRIRAVFKIRKLPSWLTTADKTRGWLAGICLKDWRGLNQVFFWSCINGLPTQQP